MLLVRNQVDYSTTFLFSLPPNPVQVHFVATRLDGIHPFSF
jgi:hypothetical protein